MHSIYMIRKNAWIQQILSFAIKAALTNVEALRHLWPCSYGFYFCQVCVFLMEADYWAKKDFSIILRSNSKNIYSRDHIIKHCFFLLLTKKYFQIRFLYTDRGKIKLSSELFRWAKCLSELHNQIIDIFHQEKISPDTLIRPLTGYRKVFSKYCSV